MDPYQLYPDTVNQILDGMTKKTFLEDNLTQPRLITKKDLFKSSNDLEDENLELNVNKLAFSFQESKFKLKEDDYFRWFYFEQF